MKKKTNRKYEMSFYESAPLMLVEKIAELNAALSKHRGNGNNGSAISFYEEVLESMKLAHLYMEKTKFIHHRNALLESSYRYLAHHNKELQERLNEYETFETLYIEDRLKDILSAITNKNIKSVTL